MTNSLAWIEERKARALPSTRWSRTATDPTTCSCAAGIQHAMATNDCLRRKEKIEVQGLGPWRVQRSALAFLVHSP